MPDVPYRHQRRRTMAIPVRRARRTPPGRAIRRWHPPIRLRFRRLLLLFGLLLPLLAMQNAWALYDNGSPDGASYIVQAGDTLSAIALAYGVAVDSLVEWNDLADPDVIMVGQRLRVAEPAKAAIGGYVVQPGDTLSAIAYGAGVTVRELSAWNGIDDPDFIAVGQVLRTSSVSPGRSLGQGGRQAYTVASIPSIEKKPSSHKWPGRPYGDPIAIVVHTAAGSLEGMDSWFLTAGSAHSAHFGIGLDGRIHQYVDLRDRAWANGKIERGSTWPGPAGINPNNLTVSIETEDLGVSWQPVTEAQYQATVAAARMALKQYPKIRYLVTHRAISPETRMMDPGARWIRSGRFAALAAELGLEPIP